MNAREILIKAKSLIDTPEKWTRETFSAYVNGHQCYCAVGAIGGAVGSEGACIEDFGDLAVYEAQDELLKAAGLGSIGLLFDYNDHHKTTHEDIMALYDKAIGACS